MLLENADDKVLIDCGASALIGLKRLGIDPNTIGTILLSHLHGDHFGGIPFLILDGQFSRRQEPLRILGPAGSVERIAMAMEVFFPGSSTASRRFETFVEEVEHGEAITVGSNMKAMFIPVAHPSGSPAHAIRITSDNHVIAYSGDTAWTPSLVEAARDADLFVCEGYSLHRRIPHHLSVLDLLEHQGELECRRIILTHMAQDVLDDENVTFEKAFDGLVVQV